MTSQQQYNSTSSQYSYSYSSQLIVITPQSHLPSATRLQFIPISNHGTRSTAQLTKYDDWQAEVYKHTNELVGMGVQYKVLTYQRVFVESCFVVSMTKRIT